MGLFDSLVGTGVSAATGNYVGAAIGAAGLITSLIGGAGQTNAAKQSAQIQGQITGLESQVNDQRQQAMVLSARRQQLEIVRNNQRARAMGLNSAVNQGALFSSGYAGGQAQVGDQSLFNLTGVQQNLGIGQNIFSLDKQISAQKMQLSQVQSAAATDSGLSSLGGSIMKSADPVSKLLQQFNAGGPMTLGGPNGPTPFPS